MPTIPRPTAFTCRDVFHVSLGLVLERGDWNLKAADGDFRRAFELAPGNVDVLIARAGLAGILGRYDEALELLQKAVALDPLGTSTLRALGNSYSRVGRFDDAETALRAALDLNPKAGVVHSILSHLRLKQGNPEEALAEASLEPHPVFRLADTAMAQHALGQAAASDATLSELIADHAEIAAYDIAQVCATRGEVDRAFEWLERGYTQRDSGMPLLANDRSLAPLHDDPRWRPLLRKMGLAD